jgi:hypothetical protein
MTNKTNGKTKKKSGFTVTVAIERETKATVVYAEVVSATDATRVAAQDGAKIGTFYVRKSAFRRQYPELLSIRVRSRSGEQM